MTKTDAPYLNIGITVFKHYIGYLSRLTAWDAWVTFYAMSINPHYLKFNIGQKPYLLDEKEALNAYMPKMKGILETSIIPGVSVSHWTRTEAHLFPVKDIPLIVAADYKNMPSPYVVREGDFLYLAYMLQDIKNYIAQNLFRVGEEEVLAYWVALYCNKQQYELYRIGMYAIRDALYEGIHRVGIELNHGPRIVFTPCLNRYVSVLRYNIVHGYLEHSNADCIRTEKLLLDDRVLQAGEYEYMKHRNRAHLGRLYFDITLDFG